MITVVMRLEINGSGTQSGCLTPIQNSRHCQATVHRVLVYAKRFIWEHDKQVIGAFKGIDGV